MMLLQSQKRASQRPLVRPQMELWFGLFPSTCIAFVHGTSNHLSTTLLYRSLSVDMLSRIALARMSSSKPDPERLIAKQQNTSKPSSTKQVLNASVSNRPSAYPACGKPRGRLVLDSPSKLELRVRRLSMELVAISTFLKHPTRDRPLKRPA